MLYNINTKQINEQLAYLDTCLTICEQVKEPLSELQSFALARALHLAVECMIDVGSVMIDGFMMRDPGGYQDIVDILSDEQVIPDELAQLLKEWVILRERLVRKYTEVQPQELMAKTKQAEQMRKFITYIQEYLAHELK